MFGTTTNVAATGPVLTDREKQALKGVDLNKETAESFDKVLDDTGLGHVEKKQEKGSGTEVGDFMRLFLEQLKHQDPLNPQEGADFLGQLAQFNSVERLVGVEKAISQLANSFQSSRVLEATGLIGKQVDVPTNKIQLTTDQNTQKGKEVKATLYMPQLLSNQQITDVRVTVTDATGQIVDRQTLGSKAGNQKVEFSWNGTDKDGNRLVDPNTEEPILDGEYRLSVEAIVGDKPVDIRTDISTLVDSVAIDQVTGVISLNASSIGTVKLSDVEKIYQ